MKENDILKMTITKSKNVDLYVAKSMDYTWVSHLSYKITRGDDVNIETKKGWNFYVVGVGVSPFAGSFTI